MRKFAFGLTFASAAMASDHINAFEEFIQTYDRQYEPQDKNRRLEIFKANMELIEATNAKNLGYTLGVTPFTDLTNEEFRAQFVGGMTPLTKEHMQNMTTFQKPKGFVPPESVDWVSAGAVSSVKNQGHCGSCWTFSATGALEGAMVVAGRKLVELSQQELLDCDTGLLGGHACNGGNPAQAFGWVKSNGMCAATAVPYQCVDPTTEVCTSALHTCNKCSTPVLKAGGWLSHGDVTAYGMVPQTQGDLEAAVAQQPISVAIEADHAVFQHYTGGVLTADCGNTLDHGVLVVGYGEASSMLHGAQKYWKIKNSWGTSWGEEGYIRIARGATSKYGECGILEMASYPTVKSESNEVVV